MRVNDKKGFTLVEALVAITILTVGILSGLILTSRSLYSVSIIQDRLRAAMLAQEGIELVREIRDTNFVSRIEGEDVAWDSGLGSGKYIIESHAGDSDSINLIPLTDSDAADELPKLKFNDSTHLYSYSSGQESPFFRMIIIEKINDSELKIQSIVKWRSKNVQFEIIVEDHLYNWFQI